MYRGTLIADLKETVAKVDRLDPIEDGIVPRASLPDFVGFEECRAAAEKQMAKDHPGLMPDDDTKRFAIGFATYVAWSCAAEATRRRK